MTAEKRRTPPMAIKLQRALEQLADAYVKLGKVEKGLTVIWEFDHFPALGLREVDPKTGHHIPHQHSAEHLRWIPKETHAIKTRGRGATTSGSDIGEMRKTRNLVKKRAEREAKMNLEGPTELAGYGKSKPSPKPKAKIAARPKPPKKPQKRASGYKRKGV